MNGPEEKEQASPAAPPTPDPATERDRWAHSLPLVPGPWKDLDIAEEGAFNTRLLAHLWARFGSNLLPQEFSRLNGVRAAPLSFYPGWLLIEAEAVASPQTLGTLDVLLGPNFIWCLDGSCEVLYNLHSGAVMDFGGDPTNPQFQDFVPMSSPLDFGSIGKVLDYARFFCNHLRGDAGTMRIVENEDDLRRCGVTVDVRPFAEHLKPPTIKGINSDGGANQRLTEATIYYDGDLNEAILAIEPDGQVRMIEDSNVVSDIGPAEVTSRLLRHRRSLAD